MRLVLFSLVIWHLAAFGCTSISLNERERCLIELEASYPDKKKTREIFKKYFHEDGFDQIIYELATADKNSPRYLSGSFSIFVNQLAHPSAYSEVKWSWLKLENTVESVNLELPLDKESYEAIRSGIESNPEILQTVLSDWINSTSYFDGNFDFKRKRFLVDFYLSHSQTSYTYSSGAVGELVLLSAFFNQPKIITETTWDNIQTQRDIQMEWLRQVAKYCRFSYPKNCYIIDYEAMNSGNLVDPILQKPKWPKKL